MAYIVGNRVHAFTHQSCAKCGTWFKYRYDEALYEIKSNGYFTVVCPECEHEHVFENATLVPRDYVDFREPS